LVPCPPRELHEREHEIVHSRVECLDAPDLAHERIGGCNAAGKDQQHTGCPGDVFGECLEISAVAGYDDAHALDGVR
jgi:hypothetical protein